MINPAAARLDRNITGIGKTGKRHANEGITFLKFGNEE
jgi:hypothetical protein